MFGLTPLELSLRSFISVVPICHELLNDISYGLVSPLLTFVYSSVYLSSKINEIKSYEHTTTLIRLAPLSTTTSPISLSNVSVYKLAPFPHLGPVLPSRPVSTFVSLK